MNFQINFKFKCLFIFVDKNSQENSISTKNDIESKVNLMKDSAMEAELRAARERAVIPLETRNAHFREMLSEKEVKHFSN